MKCEVILSGVGGQGVVVGASIMGEAAVEFAGLNAASSSEYGSETRGTFTRSSVVISDGEIAYLDAVHPDYVVCLAQVAYDRYITELEDKAVLIYDDTQVSDVKDSAFRQAHFPFTHMEKELSAPGSANIMAIGYILGCSGVFPVEAMEAAIAEKFAGRDRVIAVNNKALRYGYDLGVQDRK